MFHIRQIFQHFSMSVIEIALATFDPTFKIIYKYLFSSIIVQSNENFSIFAPIELIVR